MDTREIGLVLSCQPVDRRGRASTTRSGRLPAQSRFFGLFAAVLRGRTKKTSGYLVSGRAALKALHEASPEAAAWWCANAPNFVRAGRHLVFHESACTPLSEDRSKSQLPGL